MCVVLVFCVCVWCGVCVPCGGCGCVEEALKEMHFDRVSIYRPALVLCVCVGEGGGGGCRCPVRLCVWCGMCVVCQCSVCMVWCGCVCGVGVCVFHVCGVCVEEALKVMHFDSVSIYRPARVQCVCVVWCSLMWCDCSVCAGVGVGMGGTGD